MYKVVLILGDRRSASWSKAWQVVTCPKDGFRLFESNCVDRISLSKIESMLEWINTNYGTRAALQLFQD